MERSKAVRLEEERLRIIEEYMEVELQLSHYRNLIGELRDLAAEWPLAECIQGFLMLALYRSGRQAESLEVYLTTRRGLVEELGLKPGEELRDLYNAILQVPGIFRPYLLASTPPKGVGTAALDP